MIDIELIREQPEAVKEAARNKQVDVDIDELLKVDEERRQLQKILDDKRRERNEIAQQTKGGKPSPEFVKEGAQIKKQIQQTEDLIKPINEHYFELLEKVPNLPTDDTPIGTSEDDNEVLRQVGEKPQLDFEPKEHWQLGENLEVIDNQRAAKVSGSRFTYLKGELALLEFALINFALSVATDERVVDKIIKAAGLDVLVKPFVPIVPPVIVKREVMKRMARLYPEDERYHIEKDDLFLVGSAEHSIGPLHMDESLEENQLPLRYVGFSSSFRREAGSYGKDVKGILRLHQFDKVEMQSFSTLEQGLGEHELFIAVQEYIMQGLKLPYQVVLKCTADMGAPNARAVDIETWMPGQKKYRETHTADYMTDYQARRLRTKVKLSSGEGVLAYMNDATVVAIGRTIVAIMENYQQEDGSIDIPKVLHKYLPFTRIEKTASK